MKKLGLLTLLFGFVLFSSCENDKCNQVFFGGSTIFNDEIDAVNEAIVAYNDDPSTDNCNAYKSSVRTFLDKRIEFRDCVTAEDMVQYDAEIQGLEDQLALLTC